MNLQADHNMESTVERHAQCCGKRVNTAEAGGQLGTLVGILAWSLAPTESLVSVPEQRGLVSSHRIL